MEIGDKVLLTLIASVIATIGGCVGAVEVSQIRAKEEMVKAGATPQAARCAFAAANDTVCALAVARH